ncbi:DHA2 family efflux MFS transporter permease subunit [Pseudomonas abieticivorans]|uniref:DHA2 family efflux MFS transporter permease subunit n=1 Tax=Pseudomonas abieticivorans TaxID=2931382 RepID=UPI0020C0BD8A|nr:DHA2 family efflux MFS transporter permease subunit [Pseudomonas sp. PIA16]
MSNSATVTSPAAPTVLFKHPRQRFWLMASLLVAMVLAALDQSIVATALPSIASEMKGIEGMSWVVTLFMLTSTISAPLYGKLSDLYGQRPLFLLSIGVFVAASLLCGLATSMGQLIAFRGLQGLGAGGLMTLSQTVIGGVVEPAKRGRYQSLFSGAFAVSAAAGPLLGGFITSHFSWRWIFLINIPLGILATTGLLLTLPSLARKAKVVIDYRGALVLCVATSALLLLTHSFSLGQGAGLLSSLLLGLVAFVGFGLLYRIERKAPEPIIDLVLFANRRYAVAISATAAMAFAMMGSLVFMPLYFQAVLHQTPTESGFMTLPQVAMMLVSSLGGGAISARKQNFVGLLLVGVALECLGLLLLLVFAHLQMPAPYFFMTMALLGAGMGIGMPNATVIVQNAVPLSVLGAATASMSFCRSLGGALGVAVSGGIMSYTLGHELEQLPEALRSLNLIEGLATATVSPGDLARLSGLYRVAIGNSLFAGALVMGVALVLVFVLMRGERSGVSVP